MPKCSWNVKTPFNLQLVENAYLIQFDYVFAIAGLGYTAPFLTIIVRMPGQLLSMRMSPPE